MKVHFREKYLKKKGILDLSAEVEEGLAEEEISYQNMNVKGDKYVWIMCNDKEDRQKIRDFMVQKEYTLVVESEGKRYFGKFAQVGEKGIWKENNKIDESKKHKLDL
jgi:preprotein translocase subunit SecD